MGFHDECGVVGIYGAENSARLAYFGLAALQHRGQESAGIAVSDGKKINLRKDLGLVSEVFDSSHFENLNGSIALGHVRYATAGGRTIENAQPFLNTFKFGTIALAHNGQLVNHAEIRTRLEDLGSTFSSTSDSEVILKLIVRKLVDGKKNDTDSLCSDGLEKAVVDAAGEIKGSFSLCIMTEDCLIGVRDPNGIRPLCLGRIVPKQNCPGVLGETPLGEGGAVKDAGGLNPGGRLSPTYIIASESCAIDAVNGEFVRDIEPGEIVVIKNGELRTYSCEKKNKATCVFEYVYFARPDSVIDGIAVQDARYRMGEVLARESSVDADVVVGVPDSGIGAALGYSRATGIPYVTGIVKNKYIGRTFIAPTQSERESMVFVKLNALKTDLDGKRVVVIDDSIVRGTTSRRLVQILRRAGAREVHFRVSSPPVKFPCHLGIDTPSKSELISSTHELEEIRKEIGADSLAFISIDGMMSALRMCRAESDGFCGGCFCGRYPV